MTAPAGRDRLHPNGSHAPDTSVASPGSLRRLHRRAITWALTVGLVFGPAAVVRLAETLWRHP